MIETRLKLDRWRALVYLLLTMILAPVGLRAQEAPADSDLIEVRFPPDVLQPYRDRRESWAPTFSFSSFVAKPTEFISGITDSNDSEFTYENIFGSKAINLNSFSLGLQFNFSGFSLGPYIGVKSGSVSNFAVGGDNNISLSAQHAGLAINLDGLFAEPYVVPTFQIEVNSAEYVEDFTSSGVTTEVSSQVKPFVSYSAGILLQLNALDPESAFESLKNSGLNNTYAHLFVGQLMGTGDRLLSFGTPLSYGGGFKLEF